MSEIKSEAYNLVIDKDRARVLKIMMTATVLNLPVIQHAHPDFPYEAMKEMYTEIAKKTHELGFCEDPNCSQYKKHDRL